MFHSSDIISRYVCSSANRYTSDRQVKRGVMTERERVRGIKCHLSQTISERKNGLRYNRDRVKEKKQR